MTRCDSVEDIERHIALRKERRLRCIRSPTVAGHYVTGMTGNVRSPWAFSIATS